MNFNLQPVCKIFNYLCSVRKYSTKIVADVKINMKILSVAEKNDAAKHIAGFLSDGNVQRVIENFPFIIFYVKNVMWNFKFVFNYLLYFNIFFSGFFKILEKKK